MADELRTQHDQENIRNGLQFFDRTDDLTASTVGLAAREGDEATLTRLLANGKYLHATWKHDQTHFVSASALN